MVQYEAALSGYTKYLSSEVRLEYGGRNLTEPSETAIVRPYLEAHFPQLSFSGCEVPVLALERTFWEKATLIHAECCQQEASDKRSRPRMSRHWYDLALISQMPRGRAALKRLDLLKSVVTVKEALFYSQTAKYADCVKGQLRLIPAGTHALELVSDFEEMRREGLLPEDAPHWDEVLGQLQALADSVNEAVTGPGSTAI
ncbi:MAG: hypothetical protein GEEBNDBF_01430 [bacterium]|nr:hypothetical protein [bacterium]